MASWPVTLPQNMRLPITHNPGEGRMRTKMDAGPVKMRRRYTAVEEPVTTAVLMDGQQYQDFQTFYKTTLNGGVDRFTWDNPVNDATVELRFVEPPKAEVRSGGSPTERTWFVTMKLEIMP